MKRSLESALIAAVTVMTVLGTVSVLQGKNSNSPIDTWIAAKWNNLHARAVPSMANGTGTENPSIAHPEHPTATNHVTIGSDQQNPQPASNTTSSTNSSAAAQGPTVISTPPGQWTQADVTRLETIGVNLVFALTPTDWQNIAQALSTGESTTAADRTLAQILRQRLSSSDRTWLLEHFTGGHAVNQQDVQLLQRSISQAESELTPAERKLLEDELNALEGKTGSAANMAPGGVDRALQ